MKLNSSLLLPVLAAAVCTLPALAQQSPNDLPDAPTANVSSLIVPNGPTAVLDTSMGRITCQFFQRQAPNTVANFIGLATGAKDWTDPATHQLEHGKSLYNGTIFHRVIPEFMIQGGDPVGTGTGDPGYEFADEIVPGLDFDRPGRLAMANAGPNTDGSQFFITEVPYPSLNGHYSIFGQCDDAGIAVVKAIARVPRNADDRPLTPVVLRKVTIVPEGQPLPPAPDVPAAPVPPANPGEYASQETHPKMVNISAGVAVGMLEYHPAPVYPTDARKAGVSGRVELEARIGTDGTIQDLQVITGPEPLRQAALDTVRTWRYRPYLLNGEPVAVHTIINVIFTLSAS